MQKPLCHLHIIIFFKVLNSWQHFNVGRIHIFRTAPDFLAFLEKLNLTIFCPDFFQSKSLEFAFGDMESFLVLDSSL